MDPNSQLLRRFPLVARPRPIAKPVAARIDDLCALADRAQREDDLSAASAVLNQAALIASDCGQAELARRWCHDHANAYLLPARPLGAQAARHALEPLVNLARLHIRDGNGDAAHRILASLFQAVSTRTDTLIDDYPLAASRLTWNGTDHRDVRQWLWGVLLADGTRALTSAGRWRDAYDHLKRHKGIGQRMLDGRQVAIIAHLLAGEAKDARTIITQTASGDPWEEAVTGCLAYLSNAGKPDKTLLDAMLDRYRRLTPTPSLAVFHTRLALSIIDAGDGVDKPESRSLATDLIGQALVIKDAYVAGQLLEHEGILSVIGAQSKAALAGLRGAGGSPCSQSLAVPLDRLLQPLAISSSVIHRLVPAKPSSTEPRPTDHRYRTE
ncbi:hypothetical protein [Micromonospora sp. NPDC049662]|uniref:hypothetical protein n=1 Tax=Micromonospora sp. NPDC049662 TaxID=3155397 RepID=UPI0034498192